MAVLEGGTSGALAEVGVGAASALHATLKPVPHGSLGHYELAVTSGTIAAALAAAAQLFYFRWTDATRFAVIHRVKMSFQTLTLFTAAQQVDFGFDMFKATTIGAGGGGTQILPAEVSRMRSTMSTSLLSDARIATTAALTALANLDTRAIAQSIGDMQRMNPIAATEEQRVNDPTMEYHPNMANGDHPLVLAQNEGFVLRNRTVWPAAGTGIVQVSVRWSEVTAF